MDIGLREWLIVIGIIVIAGILFDGWRRMRERPLVSVFKVSEPSIWGLRVLVRPRQHP